MAVTELELRPDLAVLGLEIRVIGNDATQKLSISAGTISRLNRNAPEYKGYRDFNTNYIQGSAMTSGGSSGSPVISISGHAVALNAGGFSNASVALFLPLELPLKALQRVINNETVIRGTIQTQWTLQPFHECQTLGLTDEWITKIQEHHSEETSMLVAKSVLPAGPADSKIEEGDVLLKINDQIITLFKDMTSILDANVSNTIKILVHRGDEEVQLEIMVEDLHSITPDRYIMVAGSLFHDLSYNLAQQYRLAVRDAGVSLCYSNGSFNLGSGYALIHSIDGKMTPNLESFANVIQQIRGKTSKPLKFGKFLSYI
jgi:S1-C subfamily serine protease